MEENTQATTADPGAIPEIPAEIIREETSRFSSAIWYNKVQEKSITLAGCGGIGSYTAFLLGRMHPNHLQLYDPDVVDNSNISGQFFSIEDIGKSKVTTLINRLRNFSNYFRGYAAQTTFTSNTISGDILICGFDNMGARIGAFTSWKRHIENYLPENRAKCLFIDGRLAAEELQVFAIMGNDEANIDKYAEEYLFSDDEAEATICSFKQTSYMANMIGSIIVNIFTNFCANECDLVFPREVPFLTTYRADYMDFKVIR